LEANLTPEDFKAQMKVMAEKLVKQKEKKM